MAAPRPRTLRRAASAALAAALGGALVWAFRPGAAPVDVAAVTRGPIRVTVDGTGRTRVRDVYAVLAPAAGHLQRIALREGARVEAGQAVATLAAAAPEPLDPRTRAELAGRLAAARAGRTEAAAALDRARVAAEQAERDRARAAALAGGGAAAASDAEAAEVAGRLRAEEVRIGEAALRRAAAEEQAARAALEGASARGGERIVLRTPASGLVLRVLRESEGPIAAGEPVLEIGDGATQEVDVELLTTQAVRVRPGAAVEVVGWGGDVSLAAEVASIDPAAFTKVSALGVEEQRVHVVAVPRGPGWERLGHGWSLEARVTVAARSDVLLVPASALFREGDRWTVFVVEGGRARRRGVEVDELTDAAAAVRSGLGEGERVVLHPSDAVVDGGRVRPR
jgi:HlyD family secretion protein